MGFGEKVFAIISMVCITALTATISYVIGLRWPGVLISAFMIAVWMLLLYVTIRDW